MKSKLLGLLGGLLAVLALPLGAQTLEATYQSLNPARVAYGTLEGGSSRMIQSGELDFDLFSGFCTDPAQGIFAGETVVFTVQDPITLNEVGAVQRILDGYYNHSAQTSLDAAGAQWAIWEVIIDGATAPSFTDGSVQLAGFSQVIANRALGYIAGLPGYDPLPVMHLVSETRQDVITVVPEPAAAALAAATLGLLALRRRRS